MGEWSGELCLSRRPGTRSQYRVDCELCYTHDNGWAFIVLPGWTTDGASVPSPLRWYADPFSGPYASAAVLHDALYRGQIVSRAEADRVFRDAMIDAGTRPAQAWLLWAAVRAFGWLAWEAKHEDQIEWFARSFIKLEVSPCP